MAAKTQLELILGSSAAAEKSVSVANSFELETLKLAEFSAGNNDPADFDFWQGHFNERRACYLQAAKQPAPSVAAAAKPAPAK